MKFKGLLTAVVAGAMLLSACSSGNGAVALKVGDENISEGAVKFMCDYGVSSGDPNDAADSLRQNYLVIEVAKAMGIEISEDEEDAISEQLANIKSQLFGGYSAAEKALKEYGIDDSVVRNVISANTYAQQLIDQFDTNEATDDEKKQYFKDNYFRAKHVLISTTDSLTGAELDDEAVAAAKATADEVLAKAQSGEDFDLLIEQYNEDPGAESNPDGYVFTEGAMVQEFEDITKSLQPGEIGICETTYGYHIVQRLALDETPELFDQFYNNFASAIESAIMMDKYDEELAKKAEEYGITVEINQDVIDKIADERSADAE